MNPDTDRGSVEHAELSAWSSIGKVPSIVRPWLMSSNSMESVLDDTALAACR